MVQENESGKSQARNGIQVIGRAASVLRALRDDPTGLSLGQISERVGLARSTVQRIVAALQEERLIITMGNGGFRLGPEITALASAAQFNIVETCRLAISELSQKLGETVDLSVLRGSGMIFLDQVPGTHRLRAISSVGEVFPLTNTANGRAALAKLPIDRAETLVREEWKRRGETHDWGAYSAMLDTVRATNIAADDNEHTDGISAIGAAFLDYAGEVHALSVPIPTSRFEGKRDGVTKALSDTIATIEAMIARESS
ncbi:IclR family transcriptional regulator [Actibacterium lipolyticum]|uniref:HTH-type transcriptional regulator TtgV n=1 Tax=Actibacterium lipolyticum TaxID=1524263 RepID=A0A238L847_9RHOB|nr:IclR family transcriptional regulator [Actibacterium lipolyticum]SMX51177.1 HTH-type transcriptional regulator TtgV [Actibacterium lipolyticum]